MRTYNYLSNELPRELIELYSDIEQNVLRVIVKELKKGTPPEEVFAKIQDKVKGKEKRAEEVLAMIFADSKKKAVKDGKKDFDKDEQNEPVDNNNANSLIAPMVIAGMGILAELNKKIINSAMNEYSQDYIQTRNERQKSALSGFSGGFDELQRIYKKLANKGISIYESFGGGKGRNYSIENVIRRDVMYKVNQANAKVNKENFNKSSAKFIETSSHPTARTWNKYMKHPYEDHSSWQGKVFYSRDGEKVEGYEEFESTCGYGELLGIGGINCYHQFEMNYTGDSSATQYSEKEVERQYALSQEQRQYERAIRQLKSARAVYESAGDEQMTKQLNKSISMATSRLRNFCETNGLKYYNWRTQI